MALDERESKAAKERLNIVTLVAGEAALARSGGVDKTKTCCR